MKRFARLAFALLIVLLFAAPADAQIRTKVKITDVKVGLPPGIAKFGQWAPVSFRLEVTGDTEARLKVMIESYDGDEYKTTVSWPLGQLVLNPATTGVEEDKYRPRGSFIEPGEMPLSFVRIGPRASDIILRIWTDDPGRTSVPVSDSFKLDGFQPKNQSVFTVLSLGANIRGFKLPQIRNRDDDQPETKGLRGGRVQLARFDNVPAMPDHWFGYEAADLIVLPTGNTPIAFLQELFDADKSRPYTNRREALLEWVRRGGSLLISVGKKSNDLRQMAAFTKMLPATITGTESVKSLTINWKTQNNSFKDELIRPGIVEKKGEPKKPDPIPIVHLSSNPEHPYVIVMPSSETNDKLPLMVQRAYGMGKITLAAFDLDDEAFSLMKDDTRGFFWEWMLETAGQKKAYEGNRGEKNLAMPGYNSSESEDGATAGIRAYVDTFSGVPVISFGWVALFILLYTLLIGPIEYLLLKKIFGRLELTWITFPLIVLTVSVAAYYTAYSVKGKDTKTNKIDVVDVVLDPDGGGRVYGHTWFTIFSPRTEYYTLAIEPKQPWVGPETGRASTAMVDWLGGGKSGQSSISRREYSYRIDPTGDNGAANGLTGVPTLVWSTKSFAAQWAGTFDKAHAPIESALVHPSARSTSIGGSVTINLPLTDVVEAAFVYRGEFTKIPALPVGTPLTFIAKSDDAYRRDLLRDEPWFRSVEVAEDPYQQTPSRSRTPSTAKANPTPNFGTDFKLWGVLFHEASVDSRGVQNSSLRGLDQSWRLSEANQDEVMLIVRLRPVSGPGEEFMTDPASPSPTKLWLHGWPNGEKPRDPWPGSVKQETYVRFFIPIKR